MSVLEVRLERGGAVESVHAVHAVLYDGAADRTVAFGDPELRAFWRSSMKPFQALPLVEDGLFDRLGLGREELAIACASHHGRPEHVEAVRRILAAAGASEEDLACGPHRPIDEDAARALDAAGRLPGRVHNNCSGKHAAMLAWCLDRGWDPASYHRPEHPVQREILDALRTWLGGEPAGRDWGVDGCGVPTPRLGLAEMARAYARFTASDASAPRAIAAAMTAHPNLVSAPSALSCAVMRASGGALLAKEGAEGVFCIGELGGGWGASFKVRDGAMRALGPAVLRALAGWGRTGDDFVAGLYAFEPVIVRNTRDEPVARLTAR